MTASPTPTSFAAQFRAYAASLPKETEAVDPATLAWLVLAPVWPENLAVKGFPGTGTSLMRGAGVVSRLKVACDDGLLQSAQGEPPWRDTWYWINSVRRSRVVEDLLTSRQGGVRLFHLELGASPDN